MLGVALSLPMDRFIRAGEFLPATLVSIIVGSRGLIAINELQVEKRTNTSKLCAFLWDMDAGRGVARHLACLFRVVDFSLRRRCCVAVSGVVAAANLVALWPSLGSLVAGHVVDRQEPQPT